MKRILIIAMLLIAESSFVFGQPVKKNIATNSKAELEVRKVQSDRLKALAMSDISKLDQIVGNDLIYISPVGKVQTKADIVNDLKTGALKVSSIEPVEMTVRVYGNTAVVNYMTVSKFVDNGKNYDNQIRSTSVYVKRQGRWQLVSQQMTRVIP